MKKATIEWTFQIETPCRVEVSVNSYGDVTIESIHVGMISRHFDSEDAYGQLDANEEFGVFDEKARAAARWVEGEDDEDDEDEDEEGGLPLPR